VVGEEVKVQDFSRRATEFARPSDTHDNQGGGRIYMTLEQVLNEISSLTPSEQLKIAQVIWDKLPNDLGTDLSEAQQAELDRRWDDYKRDPSGALTEEEFKERMRIAGGK